MRVFVCEYVTGGGLCGAALPPGLRAEGDAMLRALVKDLGELPGVEVATTRDARLAEEALGCDCESIASSGEVWPTWRRLAADCDALWPVAPETGGALEQLSRIAAEAGCRLLGSAPDAVRLTASKRATADRLAAQGLAVVPCGSAAALPEADQGWVVKPDDGAGCADTRFFAARDELLAWTSADKARRGHIVQPYLPGEPASLSLLCGGGGVRLLSCNRQRVALRDGSFRFAGYDVGALNDDGARYQALAARIARAIPGLWGHVGVDFLARAEGPVVLEVNPRLTTSYVGLRAVLGENPAALVLALRDGEGGDWLAAAGAHG